MKVSTLSLALVLAASVLVAGPSISSASSLAYDGIDYAAGVDLNAYNGGSGFNGFWQVGSGQGYANRVDVGSLTYPGQLSVSGNHIDLAGGYGVSSPNYVRRSLDTSGITYGANGTTVWGSFTYGSPNADGGLASFTLLHGGDVPTGASHTLPPGIQNQGSQAAAGNFLLFEAIGGPSGTMVKFWDNPNLATFLSSPPLISDTQIIAGNTFDGVNFQINTGGNSEASFDEIRLGTTVQDVADVPAGSSVPEPASLAIIGLGAVALIRRRK